MRRKWIVFLILILCQLLITVNLEARTIFVDGMAPKELLPEVIKGRDTFHGKPDYLVNSPLGENISKEVLNQTGDKHQAFNFSPKLAPDILDQKEVRTAINDLKNTIYQLDKNKSKDEPINIVSHSYGTVIAYNALEEISTEHPDIQINTLITMGSPLSKSNGFIDPGSALGIALTRLGIPLNEDFKTPRELHVTNWINYYASGDPFAGTISKEGVVDIKLPGSLDPIKAHTSYFKENAHYIASDFNLITKFPERAENILGFNRSIGDIALRKAIEGLTTSIQKEATKYADLIYQIPFAKISPPELAKKINDSSQYSERNPQQKLTPVSVSFTETFGGTFTQIPDYFLASTADISLSITDGTRTGVGSRPGDFTGSYTARGTTEPGWAWVEHHDTPFTGLTATGTVSAKGFKEGPLTGGMTVNWESSVEKITLTSDKVTINTDGSLTANSLNGPIINKSSGVTEGTWAEGSLTQTPK